MAWEGRGTGGRSGREGNVSEGASSSLSLSESPRAQYALPRSYRRLAGDRGPPGGPLSERGFGEYG